MHREIPGEEPLSGGNASAGVVRVGDTVRIDLPEPLGRDDPGRQVLELIPGAIAIDHEPLGEGLLRRIGALVRSIHEAGLGLPVPDGWDVLIPAHHPDLLCHSDLASWHLVIGDGDRLVFIDATDDPGAAARLTAFVDGYQPDEQLRVAAGGDGPPRLRHASAPAPLARDRTRAVGDDVRRGPRRSPGEGCRPRRPARRALA